MVYGFYSILPLMSDFKRTQFEANMSSTRGRTFPETQERPATASSPRNETNVKSMIPKYRSLSQPPSGLAIDINSSSELTNDDAITDSDKFLPLDGDLFPHVDDFKDGLESDKLELDSPSASGIDTFQVGQETAADILRNLHLQADEEEQKPTCLHAPRRNARSLTKKGSNSGIPVSHSTSKSQSPKGRKVPTPLNSRRPPPSATTNPTISTFTREQTSMRRNYDLFLSKKHRYDMLRKDMQDKYKAAQHLLTALEQLKGRLDNSGKDLAIEPLPFHKPSKDGRKEVDNNCTFDPKVLNTIRKSVEELSLHSVELCKSMLDKRSALLVTFENIARNDHADNVVGMFLDELTQHKNDNIVLQQLLEKSICDQETELTNLVGSMAKLTGDGGDDGQRPNNDDEVDKLQQELKSAQIALKALEEKNQKGQELGDGLQSENNKMKQKIAALEKQIEAERRKNNLETEKFRGAEANTKAFKARIKELETIKQQSDVKIEQLTHDIRNTQKKLKLNEKNFEKELSELNKSRSMDKTVIERLNRDKATFDTRVMVARQTAENLKVEHQHEVCQLRHELEFARKEADVQANVVAQLRAECERIQIDYNNLQLQAMQTTQLLHSKNNDCSGPFTERECELQIEIVAQRAAIKALQEKVDAFALEKCRFIETIEQLNESNGSIQGEIVRSLVQKEEEITQLQQLLKKRDEEVNIRRLENANLKVRVEHLSNHIAMLKEQEDPDLQSMVIDGRNKLEEALMKSLENEHKMVQYEHELAQKIQAVLKLENTLKLRDGLIGLLKSKKDDLTMENRSLTKYSDEVRHFVLEAKEELKQKTEIIQQLHMSVNQKAQTMQKMGKHIEQLEDKLAITNEKRYKLQDTLHYMERKLHHVQSTAGDTRTRNKCLKY